MIALLTVALTDEPQNRLIVATATLSGKPAARAAHRATSPIPSWAGVHATGDDVLDVLQGTPMRSQAPRIVIPSRSSSRRCDKDPP